MTTRVAPRVRSVNATGGSSVRRLIGSGAIWSLALYLGLTAPVQGAVEPPKGSFDALPWRSIGPATMSGRITDLAVYEADPVTWWAATASGGLLKTTNDGRSFTHQFDREATVSIGDVTVAPSDVNIVWVGTGESNPRNSVSWGDGVYKSVDGGATWKNMGLKGSFQIGRIVIHPTDPNIVYVAALGRLWGHNEERGLYRTKDGGENWERILFIDEKTGAIDLAMKPDDPSTLLVAMYERQRDIFDSNDPAKRWGPGSGLYRTTNGGDSFDRVTQGLPTCQLGRIGLDWYRKDPSVVFALVESERIGKEPENAPFAGLSAETLEVGARITNISEDGPAAKAGLKVGDIIVAMEGEPVLSNEDFVARMRRHLAGDTVEISVSRDRKVVKMEVTFGARPGAQEDAPRGEGRRGGGGGGENANPFGTFLGGQIPNVQDQQGPDGHEYGGIYRSDDAGVTWKRINSLNDRPMYFSQIRVDPSDATYIYALGVPLFQSKDGGTTFTEDGHGDEVHVDHHAMWVDPRDGRHVILGNDGGLYVTRDRLLSWDQLNTVAIGQFYHVAVDPRPVYNAYGGLQDNGSWGGPVHPRYAEGSINEDWTLLGWGDGFVCQVDPNDPQLVYWESQNGGLGRIHLGTGERGFLQARAPRGVRYRFNWRTPYILSPHNSRIYYVAGNYVMKSLDRGEGLRAISPEITNTDQGSATALAESPREPGVLYVGTDDGALQVTRDGGATWVNLLPKKPELPLTPPAPEARGGGGARSEGAPGAEGGAGGGRPREGSRGGRGGRGGRGARGGAEAPAAGAAEGAGAGGGADASGAAGQSGSEGAQGSASGAPAGERGAAGRAGRQRAMLLRRDANKDGKIQRDEVPAQMMGLFERLDANKDGVVDESELPAAGEAGAGDAAAEPASQQSGEAESTSEGAAAASDAPKPEPKPEPASAPASASASDDPVSGEWKCALEGGMARGGSGEATLRLSRDAAGVITGEFETARGPREIESGSFDPATNRLVLNVRVNEQATFTIEGTIKDGELNAEVKFAGGGPGGGGRGGAGGAGGGAGGAGGGRGGPTTIKGRRAGAASASVATTQAPSEPRAGDPAASSQSAEPAAPRDSVSGEWRCEMTIPEEMAGMGNSEFTLELKLGEKGVVTGRSVSEMGEQPLAEGSFDAEKGTIALLMRIQNQFEVRITGKIDGEKITGTVNIVMAGQEFAFKGERQPLVVAAPPAAPAEGTPAAASGVQAAPEAAASKSIAAENNPLQAMVPVPMCVAAIETSRYEAGRVYVALDGHRSNLDVPFLFASEDFGATWKSVRGNLPDSAGASRTIREDISNPDLLYCGTEFGLWISLDRGESWTQLKGNLPTVAVHEIAQHPTRGEIVVATHGRSLWTLDISPVRQMTSEATAAQAHLFKPSDVYYLRSLPSRGSTARRFTAPDAPAQASICVHLKEAPRGATLRITDLAGETLRDLTLPAEAGFHRITWDMRRVRPDGAAAGGAQGGGRRRGGAGGFRVPPGRYKAVLTVGGQTLTQEFAVYGDPDYPDATLWGEEYEVQLELARPQEERD